MTLRLPHHAAALLAVAGSALHAAAQAPAADSAALVTLLGRDTVAVERWIHTGSRVEAEAAVRSPRASLRRFTLELAPDGTMRRWEATWLDPSGAGGAPLRVETLEATPEGWFRRVVEGDSTRAGRVEAAGGALPFVDLVHWPLEVALRRLPPQGTQSIPLIDGARALSFTFARIAPTTVVVTHPMRGPSTAHVDAMGRLQSLDAGGTTRKVSVTRERWADVPGVARRWAEADRAGRGMGELSGRGGGEFTVGGARIVLDYGTPVRRGREIFGVVVPWGQVWRTGANRATHFSTSRTLVLGAAGRDTLVVPAGEYTLFSVPESGGGWLIVNRQTGQNGTARDAALDLGRVRMRRRIRGTPTERLEIRAEPRGAAGGTLRILWDRSEFMVPFRVR